MLYRDEVIYTHSYVQTHFKSIKGYGKNMTEVKECCALAQMIQTTTATAEEDNVLPSSIYTKISELSEDNVEDPDHVFDFPDLRLDKGKLQSNICLEFLARNGERTHIRERSRSVINLFLDERNKEAKNSITTVCDEQGTLSDPLLPKHCAPMIVQVGNGKKWEKASKKMEFKKPGYESYRKTREDQTTKDKRHIGLTELCLAINYCATIRVWEAGDTQGPKSGRDARTRTGSATRSPETR